MAITINDDLEFNTWYENWWNTHANDAQAPTIKAAMAEAWKASRKSNLADKLNKIAQVWFFSCDAPDALATSKEIDRLAKMFAAGLNGEELQWKIVNHSLRYLNNPIEQIHAPREVWVTVLDAMLWLDKLYPDSSRRWDTLRNRVIDVLRKFKEQP